MNESEPRPRSPILGTIHDLPSEPIGTFFSGTSAALMRINASIMNNMRKGSDLDSATDDSDASKSSWTNTRRWQRPGSSHPLQTFVDPWKIPLDSDSSEFSGSSDISESDESETSDNTTPSRKRKADELNMRPPKKERLISSFGDMVTLVVSDCRTKFLIHKEMLCAASPFFEKACKPEWQGAKKDLIELPDDDPEIIKIILNWIYQDEIRLPKALDEDDALEERFGPVLTKLYIAADKFQMPRLQNDVLDGLHRSEWRVYEWSVMNHAYKNTPESSPLRAYFVHFITQYWSESRLRKMCKRNKLHSDLIIDLAVRSLPDYRLNELAADRNFCATYHIHNEKDKGKCIDTKTIKEY